LPDAYLIAGPQQMTAGREETRIHKGPVGGFHILDLQDGAFPEQTSVLSGDSEVAGENQVISPHSANAEIHCRDRKYIARESPALHADLRIGTLIRRLEENG
jgi:hypothetical protein